MKFLYIAAEHVSGTLSLFQQEHRRRGDECRYVTFWPSRWKFPDDICLNLGLMPDRAWVRLLRESLLRLRGHSINKPLDSKQLYWSPRALERNLFAWRDAIHWPDIGAAIRRYRLHEFDIIILDGGLDFTRDARFAAGCRRSGKHVACFFHGTDMRNRGIVREVDRHVELRLTSEWDLLELDPRLEYLYLPFDTSAYPRRDYRFHNPIRICHASRNVFKGTAQIVTTMERLKQRHPVELVLLENVAHTTALQIKNDCDIFVDQLTNAGGWGYGMSSVEALAMGLPVVTNIPPQMAARLGEHPFVQADAATLENTLERLITGESLCRDLSARGYQWVRNRHDIGVVGDQLYSYFRRAGWISDNHS